VALFEDITAAFAADTCHGAFEWVVSWVAAVVRRRGGAEEEEGRGWRGFCGSLLVEGHGLEVVVMGVVMGAG